MNLFVTLCSVIPIGSSFLQPLKDVLDVRAGSHEILGWLWGNVCIWVISFFTLIRWDGFFYSQEKPGRRVSSPSIFIHPQDNTNILEQVQCEGLQCTSLSWMLSFIVHVFYD